MADPLGVARPVEGWTSRLPTWLAVKSEPLPGFPAVLAVAQVGALLPWARNPRRNDAAAERLLVSMRHHGYRVPIILDQRGEVRAGHTRLKALRAAGVEAVPVLVQWFDTPTDGEAFSLADNQLASLAEWDFTGLADLLQELDTGATDMAALTGFAEAELEQIATWTPDPTAGRTDPDAVPETPARATSRPGDLWLLGGHRLLCGDATRAEDVTRVMGGERATVVVTDPPYAIYGSSTGIASDIADDRMVVPFFEVVLRACSGVLPLFGHAYVFADWRSWAAWWEAARRTDMRPKNGIVWDKGSGGLGSMYTNCHEWIGFWARCPREAAITSAGERRGDERHRLVLGRPNLIRCDRVPHDDRLGHNAAKPVELLAEFVRNSSEPGDVVVDFFAGSGSTLIAAAAEGRRCHALEIEPRFCDVAVRRWQDYAGKAATLDGDGRTFAAVAAVRLAEAPATAP